MYYPSQALPVEPKPNKARPYLLEPLLLVRTTWLDDMFLHYNKLVVYSETDGIHCATMNTL